MGERERERRVERVPKTGWVLEGGNEKRKERQKWIELVMVRERERERKCVEEPKVIEGREIAHLE